MSLSSSSSSCSLSAESATITIGFDWIGDRVSPKGDEWISSVDIIFQNAIYDHVVYIRDHMHGSECNLCDIFHYEKGKRGRYDTTTKYLVATGDQVLGVVDEFRGMYLQVTIFGKTYDSQCIKFQEPIEACLPDEIDASKRYRIRLYSCLPALFAEMVPEAEISPKAQEMGPCLEYLYCSNRKREARASRPTNKS